MHTAPVSLCFCRGAVEQKSLPRLFPPAEGTLMKRTHGHFNTLRHLILRTASFSFPIAAFLFLSALVLQASDPLFAPSLQVELGPENTVVPGAGWPYLFQSSEGTTVVLGHVKWIPKSPYPIHFTMRSFDGRKTWE